MLKAYESGWKSIVTSSSFPYDEHDLGPLVRSHSLRPEIFIKREELLIPTERGLQLKATLFSEKKCKEYRKKPCVIYCHSHSANRIEGLPLIPYLVPDFNFAIFDFSGCGLSDGEYVTLGAKEKEDLRAVVEFLMHRYYVKKFFFWGRSMGAVTILRFLGTYCGDKEGRRGVRSKSVACCNTENEKGRKKRLRGCVFGAALLDSPFEDVKGMVSLIIS